jgi:hypothetical protein
MRSDSVVVNGVAKDKNLLMGDTGNIVPNIGSVENGVGSSNTGRELDP